ncbi:MAG: HIT domain-containing protein [Gammaproteobacteria bacterium]|nr:HIT domain-containing protein [Gammaproteobacteria bacterium]MBT8133417.1 HIT domain-containing protein [Gammaproteobacteria bacterium]NNJ50748.1 HIT domain-containing protein [Gammaproteobacteria bacterium]
MKLHPQLEKDCFVIGEFELCTLLLLDDANYPWFILLPNHEGITEIHQLSETEQQQLMTESMFFSRCLEQVFQADKLNIASLGNMVPQLHIHHIARFKTDACWPAPVWGATEPVKYKDDQLAALKTRLFNWFNSNREQPFNASGSARK